VSVLLQVSEHKSVAVLLGYWTKSATVRLCH